MALSQIQKALIAKVKAVGNSDMAVPLDDEVCCYLVSVVADDLGIRRKFPEFQAIPSPFFATTPLESLRVPGVIFLDVYERLLSLEQDADSYFLCLASLHRARMKYERILQAQPIPTIDQVGPRGLLQFGSIDPRALAGFLFWRKWIFDIDNRAGQETGYLFEPIIANAIGGVAAGAKKSPIKRQGTGSGRQVDCVREIDKRAYEIKLRVTIAASGQGRWQEELDFPQDCKASGYIPILIVLDPTENPKLKELREAFGGADGESYVGQDAWNHLESMAGKTMATFISKYVHDPIQALLSSAPDELPDITFSMKENRLLIEVAGQRLLVPRHPSDALASGPDDLPEDVSGETPIS
ncbi:MAG: restriction endonuclease [Bryobacteraceae bacterium]